ncbi:SPRY domain-containing SOCS box protein 3 isoform X2 [Clupea harengus]|nr:SPRY domain-containing SOCS box protein 3 isoform X2 [Clupea harengus]XP_012692574.1 SPRY domain-containing SOCS box protein 3 isoform X2 [Clupea harengus]XP_031417119.1 SPRY domain-containing SOCS box protein 3 isoform X2 [Clupea harengus]
MMSCQSANWIMTESETYEPDSDSEYQAVSLPISAVMPLVVPVTGESFCQCPTQTEVTYDPSSGAPILDCVCGEEDQTCDWVWDDTCKSSSTYLSCSNRKVSFHSEYSCGTAAIRGTKELADGQHFWEIKMMSPVYGTDMMVGVGTSEVNLDQFRNSFSSLLGIDGDSWGLSYTGVLHHKGSKMRFSPRFGQGSIIGVHLDSWLGTLTFYKNRRCIGVAAHQLQNRRLYPMVCSTAAKSSMKVIRSCSVPTSLQYLCCARLSQLMPPSADTLGVLPLPPGLRKLLRSQLGWVLSLNSSGCGSDSDDEQLEDGDCCSSSDSYGESPGPRVDLLLPLAASEAGSKAVDPLLCPSCLPSYPMVPDYSSAQAEATTSDSDSDSCASDHETCQRKRCRWT